MKRLLLTVALLAAWSASAQPIQRNSFTTNTSGKTPNVLATSTNVLYPLMVLNPDGSGPDRSILFSQFLTLTSTNTTLGGNLSLNGGTNVLSIVNGVLHLDGVQVTSTETTPINNIYVTNLFVQSGRNNTLIITQALTLQFLKTNLLSTDANGLVTTTKFGAGIAWDPATQTISATASGDTTATNIVTLTQTGTNAAQLDFALVARGGVFKLALTNNAYFGAPANVNNTDFKHCWLITRQPSTGTCFVTFTNGFFAQPGGLALVNDTNGGVVQVYELISDVWTSGIVHVWMSQKSQLVP